MKYLAIFQLETLNAATVFDTKAAAEKYIKECASLANLKTASGEKENTYTFTDQSKSTDDTARSIAINKLAAHVEPVDAEIKHQLIYNKNDKNVETQLYADRKTVVEEADKIIDEYEYNATKDEDMMGSWSIDNLEQSLKIDLSAKLVLLSSKDEHVVSSYDSVDMKAFCRDFDQSIERLNTTVANDNINELKAARKKGFINLGIGLAIAAVGGILSLVSYNNAKPGEKYTIYTGIIAIGAVDACVGLWYVINPKAGTNKK